MQIHEHISHERKAQKLSMDTLASRAGVSRMTIQRIEAGADVKLQTLQDVLRSLNMVLIPVPAVLSQSIEQFVQARGRILGQPTGVGAPPSIVDQILKGNAG